MVEAAGVEPDPAENANWLMARDFSSKLVGNSLPCGRLVVLMECTGVLPCLGDMLETESPTLLLRPHHSRSWPIFLCLTDASRVRDRLECRRLGVGANPLAQTGS